MIERETKIKICGIQDKESALFTANLGVDFLGFVFVPENRYYIEPIRAREINARLKNFKGGIVGVFIDEQPSRVNEIVDLCELTHVQLHGSESPDYCRMIEGANIIKAFPLGSKSTAAEILKKLSSYNVPLYVLDRVEQGRGEQVDLSLAQQIAEKYPIFLAGGINPQNVEEAVKTVRPFGVDVASGVETLGVKDFSKIKTFIEKVRSIK